MPETTPGPALERKHEVSNDPRFDSEEASASRVKVNQVHDSPFQPMFDAMPRPVRWTALAVCWLAPFLSAYFILRGQMTWVGIVVCTVLVGVFIGLAARLVLLFFYGIWCVSKPMGYDDLSRADTIFLRIVNIVVVLMVLTIIWFGFAGPAFLPYQHGFAMLVCAIALIWMEVYR